MIIVFVNNSFFQVYSLFFVSLAQISFLIKVKPFEDSILNLLEGFNEIIILVCTYHLLFFIDGNVSNRMKYMGGWSLDLLIIF